MISDEQLIAYLSGRMSEEERKRFEEELAGDADALRRLVEQERMDAALRFLAGGATDRARVKQSILEVALGSSAQQFKQEVLADVGGQSSPPLKESSNVWRWFLAHWRIVAGGGVAIACLALALRLWPDWQSGRRVVTAPPASTETNALLAVSDRRDPAQWPFAADSPWNTSTGSGAAYEEVIPSGLNLATGAYIGDAHRPYPVYFQRPTDPFGRIFVQDNPAPFATTRIPRAALLETQPRVTMHLVSEDRSTVLEMMEVVAVDGKDLRVFSAIRGNLRGTGIPPQFRSVNACGLTPLGGDIRRGELSGGIRHVLGAIVPLEAMTLRADGSSHVWPAEWSPDNPQWAQRFNRTGNVYFGTLLAIPPSVDLAAIGVGTNGPAYEIARALQDYGAYVRDVFTPENSVEWQRAGGPQLVFCAESDETKLPPDFHAQLARVVRHLKVVSNNGSQSIGGGGTRRRPPAPDFGAPPNN